MWTTWPQTRPRRASFAHVPTFAQVHEAIKQQNSVSLQNIDARYIDIYLYSKEARSPRLSFLLDPSLASDSGRLEHGNASKTNRKSCARTPPGPTLGSVIGQFNFRMTASLLGTIATAFCRGGQLERPGDVICGGNRRISAAHALQIFFARSLSFTCQGLRCASCQSSVWSVLLQVARLDRQQ